MTKRSTNKKTKNPVSGGIAGILGALVLVIAALIFALTGTDLTGGTLSGTATKVSVTRVNTVAAPTGIATLKPAATVVQTTASSATTIAGGVQQLSLLNALGYQKDFWRVYFTQAMSSSNRAMWRGGIEDELARSIGEVRSTLDIAAFEWESAVLTQAVLDAVARGVKVRMVVDNEHTLDDPNTTIGEIEFAGVPIVNDDRSGLMHDKFMIMDGLTVWLGSMNYQPNDLFRNNNNVLMLRSRQAAEVYTAEFEEMFTQKKFGVTSPISNTGNFTQSGTNIQVYFAAENPVMARIIDEVNLAKTQVRFLAFSFTDFDLAKAMLDRAAAGVGVSGVFETTGSLTQASELRTLYCAGLPVFQDGNPGVLHNKVVIIDGETVISGSFNFSSNATNSNDENLIIIKNKDIAQLYLQEWERIRAIAKAPTKITCQ